MTRIVLTCQRCGEPLEGELGKDEMTLLRSGVPVLLQHEVCPRDRPTGETAVTEARSAVRTFEVTAVIREVFVGPGGEAATESPEVLLEIRGNAQATDLAAAMRSLAHSLGEAWQVVEERAAIADPRAVVNLLGPS